MSCSALIPSTLAVYSHSMNQILHKLRYKLRAKADLMLARPIAQAYHRNWYEAGNTWMLSTWMGFPIQQCPFDMQRYQELIHTIRPQAIVQTGVNQGGSLLFFAHMLDALDAASDARVVGIDIKLSDKAKQLSHRRIHLLEGSSTAPEIVKQAREIVGSRSPVLVSLDSDHRCEHVYGELQAFASFVGPGGALVIEDTNVNGHPVLPFFGPGPREALEQWRLENRDGFIETSAERDPNWLSFHSWFDRR